MNNSFDKAGERVLGWLISIGEEGGISGLATPADQYQVSGMNIFASILSVFFITIILYSLVRMYEIRRNEKKKLHLADLF
ncbi:MAG: hypothetical protein AAB819_01255 [Patescibacteria group bacterium]